MSFELVGVRLVAEDAAQFGSAMAGADKAVAGFGDQAASTFGKMPGLSQVAIGALRQVGVIAVEAFAAAGKAAISFVGDSIGAAGDFEAGMNKFTAVAGGALDEAGLKTKDFKDLFLTLGKELPVSTADVQAAATEMIKGGIDPATIAAGGLKQNIQFAAAAMEGDLAGAATVSAKILGGWAEQGATAAEKAALLTSATDLLTKAANASTVDVKELALGLYNVQGTAKTSGLSLEETTTALAELSPRFASSSEAGTSFKNFLVRLQPTTKPAIAAMQGLGLYTEEAGSAFFDANGKFVGVAQASALLQDKLKGLTDAQKVQALQTIFGNDAMNTAAAFAEMGAQGYTDMADSMAKANGVQANAQTMQAGYNVALDNFKGSIEALQITIGSVLLPVLTQLFNDYLAPGINTLTTLAGALSGDQDAFNSLSPAIQGIIVTVEQLWADFQAGVGLVQGLIASFQATGAESGALGGFLGDLSGIWTRMQEVVTSVAGAYENIVAAVFPIVSAFIAENGDDIMATVSEIWDTIVLVVQTALDLYNAIVPPVLNAIAQFIRENGDAILAILRNVWTVVKSVIDIALALIQGIIKTALALIRGDWEGAWTTIKETGARIWDDIKAIISSVWDTITIILTGVWDSIKTRAAEAWDGIKGAVEGALNGLTDTIKKLPDTVAGVGKAIVDAIWDGIRDQWYKLVDWFDEQLQKLKDQLPFSEPKDPSSPLRGLKTSGRALVTMLQTGMAEAGPLRAPRMDLPASPMALMAGGSTTNATYNQQRSVALNYHTTYAPPASTSLAIASALAY